MLSTSALLNFRTSGLDRNVLNQLNESAAVLQSTEAFSLPLSNGKVFSMDVCFLHRALRDTETRHLRRSSLLSFPAALYRQMTIRMLLSARSSRDASESSSMLPTKRNMRLLCT